MPPGESIYSALMATILVADDEQLIRWSLSERLQADGLRVIEAATGQEAIDKVHEGVDLVFCQQSDTSTGVISDVRAVKEAEADAQDAQLWAADGSIKGLVSQVQGTDQMAGFAVDGMASWYGPGFDGRTTASGAVFDQEGFTVASRTLPLGTMLLITRGERSVLVLVNDRGPYVGGRVLDLSKGVARVLDTIGAGVARVHAEVVVPVGE